MLVHGSPQVVDLWGFNLPNLPQDCPLSSTGIHPLPAFFGTETGTYQPLRGWSDVRCL